MVAVLVVTRDPAVELVAEAFQAEGISAELIPDYFHVGRFLQALGFAGGGEVVAILDELAPEVAYPVYKLLHTDREIPTLMLVGENTEQQLARDPHRPRSDEFVAKPARVEELVLRVKALAVRAGYELPRQPFGEIKNDARPPVLRRGALVVVFSVKGGAGKTTVAVNLAVGLRQLLGLKTLLVDTDLWFGDTAVLLNIHTEKSISNAFSEEEDLDLLTIERAIVRHSSGISVLPRPPHLAMAEQLSPAGVVKGIRSCQAVFDFVVVDTHSALDELNLQLLEAADRILILCTPEMSATHNTSRLIEVAHAIGVDDKFSFILNRANSGMSAGLLEKGLGISFWGMIPSAGRPVVEAANLGIPLIVHDMDAAEEITRQLARLVCLVAGQPVPEDLAKKIGAKRRAPSAAARP